MSAENFGSDDLGIPGFLDRRDEVPRHVCVQCQAKPDGKEEPVRHGDALVWLHPECRRFWLRENPADRATQEERPVELTKYDRACRAIADAKLADEVKDIRDKAIAIKAYARQAKNRTLEADAFEIRVRAERRLGEMMAEQPKNRGEAGQFKSAGGLSENPPVTLNQAGIDKNLAHRARTLAAMPTEDFTVFVDEGSEQVQRGVERAALNDNGPGEPPAHVSGSPKPERQDVIDQIKALFKPLSPSDKRHCAEQLRLIYRNL